MGQYILKNDKSYCHVYHDITGKMMLDDNINPKYVKWYETKHHAITQALVYNNKHPSRTLQVIDRKTLQIVDNSLYEDIFNFQKNNADISITFYPRNAVYRR